MTVFYQIAVVIIAVAGLEGCASIQRTELYFGRNIPGGGQVTEEQWRSFSDSIITPAFPGGYTETNAQGKWMDTGIEKR